MLNSALSAAIRYSERRFIIMGKFFNKIRQVFNIFLILALVVAASSLFIYFMTSPEQRGVTFLSLIHI